MKSLFTNKKVLYILTALFIISAVIFAFQPAEETKATDFTSVSFIVRDPLLTIGGTYSSSVSFQHYTSLGQTSAGEISTSNFISRSGFLYFPVITSSPVVSATAGDAQVALSWTAATAELGYNVSAYEVGQAAVSDGPYSYTNVGNVLSSTRSGLTNGTTYYFIIRALDALNDAIVTSTEVSAAPAAAEEEEEEPLPSGGGAGPTPTPETAAVFSGRAYPASRVSLLKDSQLAAATVAGPDAKFKIKLAGLSGGNYIFSLYSEDSEERRSALLSFPITLTRGATTYVSGIYIAPTIAVDKEQVKRGDNIAIFGQSSPESEITIQVNSDEQHFVRTDSDEDGAYLYNFDSSPLELGDHFTKSKAATDGEISSYSKAVSFLVGGQNILKEEVEECGRADLNCDRRVNLIDFSIAAFWYQRSISPSFALIEKSRLNGDGKINLVDFSIMAYYWTG